jgi:hypothetical protein
VKDIGAVEVEEHVRRPRISATCRRAPLNRRQRHRSIPCFAGRKSTLRVAIAVIKIISETKKADRVGHQQRRTTRSAYSSSGPRPMAVAVRLVFRLALSLISLRLLLLKGNSNLEPAEVRGSA